MKADCHMHMILDGLEWRAAIRRHSTAPNIPWIREILQIYHSQNYVYLRDGGDRWNAGRTARTLAPEYGITYRTPLAPLCKAGHYGGFIGETYGNFKEYAALVRRHRAEGADFIKIMIPAEDIRELIHIAHEEGFSVMAHANGARTVEAAARAGVDSVEHGAYLDSDALHAMAEAGTIWCPTLSAIGNLRGRGRFDEAAVTQILSTALQSVAAFENLGGLLAPGTDAGAWSVPHGSETEADLFRMALGNRTEDTLTRGIQAIRDKF